MGENSCYVCSRYGIQAGLFLCIFFLCNFALMPLENLHHFLNLRSNVMIWH